MKIHGLFGPCGPVFPRPQSPSPRRRPSEFRLPREPPPPLYCSSQRRLRGSPHYARGHRSATSSLSSPWQGTEWRFEESGPRRGIDVLLDLLSLVDFCPLRRSSSGSAVQAIQLN
ncbi:hypothetical protein U9M48_031758 [Paspalum notatum var. saurae]|uniref:Uncharacterized protein n=1 Tax=Paspalum notatum var. saurae TaxID=547442 RepID=A0AAQ3U3M2_PASNO